MDSGTVEFFAGGSVTIGSSLVVVAGTSETVVVGVVALEPGGNGMSLVGSTGMVVFVGSAGIGM